VDHAAEAQRRRGGPLSVSGVEAMVAAVPDRCCALIVFVAGMGLRQGE
jgi:hypothetical protein